VPVGTLRPKVTPVDMSSKKPAYMPEISMSPTDFELNVCSKPTVGSTVVVKSRSAKGTRTIMPH
jgi:hypothetical protein